MPYAILASSLPQRKLGIYMGLFNIFIVVPAVAGRDGDGIDHEGLFPDQPIWTMLAAAIVMTIAALAMLRVRPTSAHRLMATATTFSDRRGVWAFVLGVILVTGGVLLHLPMFLMGRHDALPSSTGCRWAGDMIFGMVAIIGGVAIAAYGLLPRNIAQPARR